MARLGLERDFSCAFANDFDPAKCAAYAANFGDAHLVPGDVGAVSADDLPSAAIAWASFPCQDLSLAGARGGMKAGRSGTFWAFWGLMRDLAEQERVPPVIVLENVPGLLTSGGGQDFGVLVDALVAEGYRVGGLVLDAADYLPQSRARLFLVAVRGAVPTQLVGDGADYGITPGLRAAVDRLSPKNRAGWLWWQLPGPVVNRAVLTDLVERDVDADIWRGEAKLQHLLSMMSPAHTSAVEAAEASGEFRVGAVYRRMRGGEQRAEVRYDGMAGCLRTLKGGSSRQLLLITDNGRTRLRPMLAVEGARLMGLPPDYQLPDKATAAFNLLGDGVCPPVVVHISRHILAPLSRSLNHGRDMAGDGAHIAKLSLAAGGPASL